MIHRDRHSESNGNRSNRRLGFERRFKNSQRPESEFENRDSEFRFDSEDSEFNRSEFRYDRDPYLRSSRGEDNRNRFGEGRIYRDYYEDESGMRHPLNDERRESLNWSRDSRSEASMESHYGKGPKNYRRSDARIQEDICDALTHHEGIDASDIDVKVESGHVTLSGEVEDRRSKRLAEDIVDDIRGVEDVTNRLSLKARQDGWLKGLNDLNRMTE